MDSRFRNTALFLTAAILIGGMYVANKAGLQYLPPVYFASLRFLIAAGLLFPYVAFSGTSLSPRTRNDYFAIIVGGGFIVTASNVFLFIGQQYTTSAVAAILIGLSPILTIGLSAVFLPSEPLSFRRTMGISLGFLGVIIIASPDPASFFSSIFIGKLLIIVAAFALAVGGVSLRHLQCTLSPLAIATWSTLVGGLSLLLISFVRGEAIIFVPWTSVSLAAVFYNGVIATPIGYAAYFKLLDEVGPVRVNLITYMSPLITSVLGWLILGEILSHAILVGFLVIVFGFVLLEYTSLHEETVKILDF